MRPVSKMLLVAPMAALMLSLTMGQAAQPTPRAFAVVNISKVFSALNEKIDDDTQLEAMTKKIKDEQQSREAELEKFQDQLKNNTLFNPNSPEYKKLQDDAMKKSMEYQVFVQVSQQRLLMEQRLKTIQLYRNISKAVEGYAQSHGIGLVFVADDTPDFTNAPNIDAVKQLIANRKVIYAHPDYDITQQIIEKMNEDYKLGGNKASTNP